MEQAQRQRYARRFVEAGESLQRQGAFFQEEANNRGLALIEAKVDAVRLFFLVDPEEERVVEARYFTEDGVAMAAVAEVIATLAEGATLARLFALTSEQVDRALRDERGIASAPSETFVIVPPLIKEAEKNWETARMVWQAANIVRARRAEEPEPISDEEWQGMTDVERRLRIDAALDGPVRDYLHAEGGEVEVVDMVGAERVKLRLSGICASCAAAGATVGGIEGWLKEKVQKRLNVVQV